MLEYRNDGFLMTCASSDKKAKNDTESTDEGIVGFHAYSLLWIGKAAGERLVYLRNPWGRHEWTGKWSDADGGWNTSKGKAVKEELLQTGKFVDMDNSKAPVLVDTSTSDGTSGGGGDDGAFFMPFSEFVEEYGSVQYAGPSSSFVLSDKFEARLAKERAKRESMQGEAAAQQPPELVGPPVSLEELEKLPKIDGVQGCWVRACALSLLTASQEISRKREE